MKRQHFFVHMKCPIWAGIKSFLQLDQTFLAKIADEQEELSIPQQIISDCHVQVLMGECSQFRIGDTGTERSLYI